MVSSQNCWMGREPTTEMERRQAAVEEMWAREHEREQRAQFEEAPSYIGEQTMSEPNIANMTAKELEDFIANLELEQREYLKRLRAYLRVVAAQEAMKADTE